MSPGLSRAIFLLALLASVVAQLFLLRSVLRTSPRYDGDRRKNPRRDGFRWTPDRRRDPPPGQAPSSPEAEIVWVVIPAVGLAALFFFSWLALPAG